MKKLLVYIIRGFIIFCFISPATPFAALPFSPSGDPNFDYSDSRLEACLTGITAFTYRIEDNWLNMNSTSVEPKTFNINCFRGIPDVGGPEKTGPGVHQAKIYTPALMLTDVSTIPASRRVDVKFEIPNRETGIDSSSEGLWNEGQARTTFAYYRTPEIAGGNIRNIAPVKTLAADESSYPISEPAAMVLIGIFLLGLAGVGRKTHFKHRNGVD
ncbi:MAG: hypothetical protein R6U50_07345 [Desulfobacterales bacterium]